MSLGDFKEKIRLYDSKYWKHGRNVTVRQLYEYLQEHIPDDAIVCIEGKSNIDTYFS